jgi:dTDP-glucose 4,6-dehydratase
VLVPGDGATARPWIHVDDHSSAVFAAVLDGQPGSIYHLTTDQRSRDLDLAHDILAQLGKPRDLVRLSPGHSVPEPGLNEDAHLAHEQLEWKPRKQFPQALRETIDWYVRNREWWESLSRS